MQDSKIKNLSVFFPCFNEEKNIDTTTEKAIAVLEKLKIDYEIIIVNDGSTDQTGRVADKLASQNPKIRVIHHPQNLGYGGALKTGFAHAKYPWVAFTDSDGQFDFSQITRFLDKSQQSDFILGYRLNRADSLTRSIGTMIWSMTARVLLGLSVKDYSCGFKLIKKSSYEALLPLEAVEKVTQIEMLVKARRLGFNFVEIGVNHYPRKFGTQTGADLKIVFRSFVDIFKLWWKLKDDKFLFIFLVLILGLAAFFRLWKIDGYMTFLGDEGRDALMIKRILTTFDLPLIGPPTSIGNIYLGPLYYYMMSLPMAIFWLSPVSAAVMVAVIGVATVWLIYYLASEWFGKLAGLLSAFLYAISPITIIYSRSSWNPNPAPFFALVAMFGAYLVNKTGNFRWFILTGVAVAFAIQMHYLAVILLPIFGLLWLYEVSLYTRGKLLRRYIFSGTIFAVLVFLILMSPLVIFDLKHNFLNYRAISSFFLQRETTVNLNPLNTIERIIPIYSHNLVGRYMTGEKSLLTAIVASLVILPLLIAIGLKLKGKILRWSYLALGTWLVVGIFGLALYKQSIYDHYLGFLNPVSFILLGSLVSIRLSRGKVGTLLWIGGLVILVLILALINLQSSPLKNPPNMQLQRTQKIAKFVINEAGGKSFNFALIARNNYDAAYQFYLDIYGHKPKQVPFDITDQLFVVCEDSVCQPVGHPKQEISHFGMARVEKESNFLGVKVYKLVHNPSGKP